MASAGLTRLKRAGLSIGHKREAIAMKQWSFGGKGMNQMEAGIPSEPAVEIRGIYWSWVQMNDGAIWNV